MITASGAKLLDFGVARAPIAVTTLLPTAAHVAPGHVTISGDFGTLCYMAPEQLRGERADARTDVFAFGCVLFEMFTGARAFPERIRASGPELDPLVQPRLDSQGSIPDDIQSILRRCLAMSRGDRWQTVDALLQVLQTAAAARTNADSRWSRSVRFPRRAVAIASVMVLLLGTGVWTLRPRTTLQHAAAAPKQLAVIPLRTVGEMTPDDDHLGLAIADSIITRLATVRGIALRPTTAVMSYADGRSDPARASADLGVNYLLTGTIQRGPSTYRVTFQLVQSPEGAVAWGRTYDVVRSGLRDVQDGVAEQLVDALQLQLGADERNRLRRRHTEKTDAYEHYLKGRAALLNYTETGMTQAITSFEQAIALDPEYALARGGLAIARAWFSIRYAYETDALDGGARAEAAARAALAADSSLAEARLAIAAAAGTVYGRFNWPVVIDEASRALDMDPTLELAHVILMRAYFHLGLLDRMDDEAEAAHRLNPLGNVEVARLEVARSLFSGRYDSARDQATALLARSDAPVIRTYRGLAQFYSGDVAGARATLAAVTRGGRPDVRSQAALASIEAAGGDRNAARARALSVEHGPYMDHHVAYSLAATWAQLGNAHAAIKWLRQSADSGFPCFPSFERDPLLSPIRQNREFTAFLALLRHDFERDRTRYARRR
jgi:TolB-like protein